MNPARPLSEWYQAEGRSLPWREEVSPYRVWVSEIILQQTRVAQGRGYFLRFMERFPTLESLASASQEEVLKAWEGLGYYSRARNLHATAQTLIEDYGGKFPNHYSELLKLKGIGPYTSRAIGSIAFGNVTGVLDGNVFRVLSRYLMDFSPIDVPATRTKFQAILDEWVQETDPAEFNQAMMDLGATICSPTNPKCEICPLQSNCKATKANAMDQLPVKAKKLKRKTRFFNFYLVKGEQEILVRRRPQKGIWAGLWEIPNVEQDQKEWKKGSPDPEVQFLGEMKHVFTHFDMMIKVYVVDIQRFSSISGGPGLEDTFISTEKISTFAFSRAVLKIFEAFLAGIF